MAKVTKKFPTILYVKREEDGLNYFVSSETIDELAEIGTKVKIATYQLVIVEETITEFVCKPVVN